MKSIDKQRLQDALIKYCDQIGILPHERPTLILDRNEYNKIRKVNNKRGIKYNACGECFRKARTVYVDARCKEYTIYKYLTKKAQKRTGIRYYYKTVKATYRHKLDCLVHELVHYRFKSMRHGLKFENRIKEILKGQIFPQVELYVAKKEE